MELCQKFRTKIYNFLTKFLQDSLTNSSNNFSMIFSSHFSKNPLGVAFVNPPIVLSWKFLFRILLKIPMSEETHNEGPEGTSRRVSRILEVFSDGISEGISELIPVGEGGIPERTENFSSYYEITFKILGRFSGTISMRFTG